MPVTEDKVILELILNGSSASFAETLAVIVFTVIAALLSITIREYVKARITVKMGGSAMATLNPIKQINFGNLISVVLMTVFSASWIKAKHPGLSRGKSIAAALSAPITNLVIAFISVLLCDVIRLINVEIYSQTESTPFILIWVSMFFSTCVLVNIAFAVFDILPIPGTNGGIILSCLLPEKAGEKFLSFEKYSYIILLFIVIVCARSGVTATVVNAIATAMETPFLALFNLLFPAQINY